MIYFLLFLLQLLLLWRLSRIINSQFLASLPFLLYALLFLPGTFIHELSHFLMAKLMFVPVGKFTLMPKRYEKEVVLGSVSIAKVDIIRRLIIGAAPVIFGLLIIISTISFSISSEILKDWKAGFLISYLVFVVGNTMFSSKKDLEGAWKVGLTTIIIFTFFYIFGVRFFINSQSIFFVRLVEILKLANIYLLGPILIDAAITLVIRMKMK